MRLAAKLREWRRLIALIAGAVIAGFAGISGSGQDLENALHDASAHLRRHPASGSLAIVEIDAHSIAAINHWPWSRRNYAEVVDRLRRAGAASIAFDVDFSSYSDPQDDAAFASGLDRDGGRVILPTFGQRAGSGRQGWTDSLPIPALRNHALLAGVNILPDSDGVVRRMPLGTRTAGLPRPSLSAMLAAANGAADLDFPIDFAIDPAGIPRHSFVDIRDGQFDPSEIKGRQVLIGATAIELGDRYAIPNYGVVPGVVIQALATETLGHGSPREGGWVLPLVFALNIAWLILNLRRPQALFAAAVTAPLSLFAVSVALTQQFDCIFTIVPALVALTCCSAIAYAMQLLAAAKHRRTHDDESGLPNRLALRLVSRPSIGAGIVAARFLDYDKLVTGLGEEAIGDLIRRVHDRIALVTEGHSIYRVEDRVLAWPCSEVEHLEQRFATLRTIMLPPVEVSGRRVDVTLAFGFAAATVAENAERIIARALLAADHALADGEGWHVYGAEEEQTVDRELSLLGELDDAIVDGDIQVFYQPKLCLATNCIVSVEALVRWKHRTRGQLPPDLFIPLAERNGRIAGLTLHVLEQTIGEVRKWHERGHSITAAVNLSAKLLNSTSFIADLRGLIEQSGVAPNTLTFEVTESAAMTSAAEAAAALRSFQEMGIAISIDDYGTGQSTLSYLKQLPLNELKIDRCFVQFVHKNRSDAVLVQSTINLAHELGLKVVAEGVEEVECLEFLRSIGCDMVQGYFISKPLPADELAAMLRSPLAAVA